MKGIVWFLSLFVFVLIDLFGIPFCILGVVFEAISEVFYAVNNDNGFKATKKWIEESKWFFDK